jgi:hypothetical protein
MTAVVTECDHLEAHDSRLPALQANGHGYSVNIRQPQGLGMGSLFNG